VLSMQYRACSSKYRVHFALPLRLTQLESRITPTTQIMGPFASGQLPPHLDNGALSWHLQAKLPAPPVGAQTYLNLQHLVASQLDLASLQPVLSKAPSDSEPKFRDGAVELALPKPEGGFTRFRVWQSTMMEPGLASQFPTFKTYRGQGIDDPAATLAADITSLGFHAQVLSPNGAWYIDPYWHLQTSEYVSYYGKDLRPLHGNGCTCAICQAAAQIAAGDSSGGSFMPMTPPTSFENGSVVHTYRLAVAADGEYTAFFGGTVINAQAAIITAINRVNQIYENDLAVHLTLVANNTSIIYTDPATDPFTDNDPAALWTQNQTICDAKIGAANYDIGHVFTTGSGGKGDIGSVGQPGRKAHGTTGQPTPTTDAFYVDFVAHEMGHQFGGHHTFNGNQSSNASQRDAPHAYEPGSASTIMGYAGVMPGDDLQPHSDPYFHIDSIKSIVNYIATIPSVGTTTNTGNQINGMTTPGTDIIPARTPFSIFMYAGGGAKNITYTIEENDLGPAQALGSPDNGSSPLFRSEPPASVSNTLDDFYRYFPRLDTLVANKASVGEQLPTTNRTMHFIGTARDNTAGDGAIETTLDIAVQAIDTGAPFQVTNLDSAGITWSGKSQQTITWDVAGTNANGINAANVSIAMSTDGGLTYPTMLLASTPNNGSATITVPNLDSTTVRVKVAGVGDSVMPIDHSFFDINNANIKVTFTPNVTMYTGADSTNGAYWDRPTNWSNGVPGPGDTAVLKTASPHIRYATSIGALVMDSAFTGAVYVEAPLVLTRASTWSGGYISISSASGGSVTNNGTVTLNNSASVNIWFGTCTNNGTMIQTGTSNLNLGYGATLDTPVGGVFDLQSDALVASSGSVSNFNVEGTLRRSPGVGVGTGTIDVRAKITGLIDVQSTTLFFDPSTGYSTTSEIAGATMNVVPGAKLQLGTGVNCSGNLTGTGGGSVQWINNTIALAADTTLSFPAPMLQWSNSNFNLNGKTLTNSAGSTINLTAELRMTGGGTFINQGMFLDTAGKYLYLNGAADSFINDVGGVIDFQGNTCGITYESVSGTFTNAGTIRRSVGTGIAVIECNSAIGGGVDVQSGTLALASFTAGTGTVTNLNATIDKSATLDLTGGRSVNYAGTLNCIGGPNGIGTVTSSGAGQININSDTTFNFPDNMFQWKNCTFNIAAGATLFNPSGSFMTLSNSGNIFVQGGGTLVNNGWMRQTGLGNLYVNGAGTTLKNIGTFDLQTTGGMTFSSTSGTFLNQGVYRKSGATGTSIVQTIFNNSGGTIDIQTGTLDLPGTVDLGKGTLQGNGTLLAPVTNSDGFVRPGSSPGLLTITGNYAQSGTGSLNVELTGTTVATQYDQLVVNGTVSLGGPLVATLTYPAKVNDTFIIINNDGTADAVTGTFNGLIEGKTFSVNGATVQISYKGGDGNDVQLKVIAVPSAPPRVSAFQINDGSAQRSRITSLRVTFDQNVALPAMPATAFELKRQGDGAVVALSPSVDDTGPGTVVTFTFTGGPLDFGSLADGRYTLTAKSALIASAGGALDGDNNGAAGGDYILASAAPGDPPTNIFRLFGDINGDGAVAANDFVAFRQSFNGLNSIFDSDGDGFVSASDFVQFRNRFNTSI
jgi:Metallo-peptidase family M12B Reprolysin-like